MDVCSWTVGRNHTSRLDNNATKAESTIVPACISPLHGSMPYFAAAAAATEKSARTAGTIRVRIWRMLLQRQNALEIALQSRINEY